MKMNNCVACRSGAGIKLKAGFALFFMAVFSFAVFAGITRTQGTVEAIVAIVNDDVITLSDYKQAHDALYQELQRQFQGEDFDKVYRESREALLDELITNILLTQEAEKKDLDVSEQLKMTIDGIKKENNLETDEQLIAALRQQGVDYEEWLHQAEEQMKRQGLIYTEVGRSIVIDDNEILNYHRAHPEEFTEPAEVTLKAIYLSSEGKIASELEGKKQEILGKLNSGTDFGAVAAEYSEGPEKETDGDLGSFVDGTLSEPLNSSIKGIEPGAMTSWIETGNGWYLIQVVSLKPSRVLEFDEVRDRIQRQLFNERNQVKMTEYLERLKAKSYIKILLPNPLDF